MNSDPAVEAVNRTYESVDDYLRYGPMLGAAREALKPIRELHRVGVFGYCKECGHEGGRWPCGTAKLIYSESELS